jgi:hypothetical protein
MWQSSSAEGDVKRRAFICKKVVSMGVWKEGWLHAGKWCHWVEVVTKNITQYNGTQLSPGKIQLGRRGLTRKVDSWGFRIKGRGYFWKDGVPKRAATGCCVGAVHGWTTCWYGSMSSEIKVRPWRQWFEDGYAVPVDAVTCLGTPANICWKQERVACWRSPVMLWPVVSAWCAGADLIL